jgi:glyoxylase-like metal-dependent hydrolase (beta-lactamase superfamily II)
MPDYTITNLVLGIIAANCWIIHRDNGRQPECTVIDPGDEAEVIIARLARLRLRPAYILLTHGHLDHIAALPDLYKALTDDAEGGIPTGPAPVVAIHRGDAPYLGPGAYAHHKAIFAPGGSSAYLKEVWKPMPAGITLLEEGDTIGPFKVLHTPGHSPGSSCFYLEEGKILFSGDTLFQEDIGRTDFPGGDGELIARSLERLLNLDGGIKVMPGHGPATTIAHERAYFSAPR